MNVLARALVPIAQHALSLPVARPVEDEPLLAAALDAVDGFLATPCASRYLTAARSLSDLARLRTRSTQVETLARRSLRYELDRLDTLLGDESVGTPAVAGAEPAAPSMATVISPLRSLPPDPRAGRRIQALAALIEAHHTIAQRVRAPEQHRARLALPDGSDALARRTSAGRPAAGRQGPDRRADRGARAARKRRA